MNTHHLRPERPGPDRLDGRYRLVEPLGRGGTSEVWRGLDERLSRPVAVKILHGRGNDWMRNEAQALALLTHPHIATVYDYGYSQRRHYLVMELVKGEPLSAALDRGPLPWSAAVRSCAQVASALAVAHARGVVHRDVTPGNIMLTAAGVKLIDFGISALAGDRETTVDGELYGTPPYAAPERLHSSAVAPAVDVFALGVVLYRAVSGCLPWHAHTAEQLVAAQRNADPADLPAVAGLPDEVGDVCMRCLARDPAERPSAAELAALLATTIPDTVAIPDTVELAEPSIEPLTGV
jgi:serine/threonine-protein kinase